MTKRKVLLFVIAGIFIAWFLIVIKVNATCERQVIKEYEIGDIVPFGQNYYEDEYEIIDGYELQVISANVYKYEDYLSLMSISGDENAFHSKYIYDLEICFYNLDQEGERGINLISTYLASYDNRLAINIDLLTEIYPQLGYSPMEFRIRPGTSMVMHIPFQMEPVSSFYVQDEEVYFYNNDFYLNVTQYPEKQIVRIPRAIEV